MPNEIEAKFSVTDESLAQQLRTVETIDGLTLTPGKTSRVRDTYLDTHDRRLLAAGYFCRSRKQEDGLLITVKKITNDTGAIHEREELEIKLKQDVLPTQWQDSPARERVLSIVRDEPLQPLLTLEQTRVKRGVKKGEGVIAEWSVDDVRVRAANRELRFKELEIELVSPGTRKDLDLLVASVRREYRLTPESKSKFESALAWMEKP